MKSLKTLLPLAAALVVLPANADWTDYFWIGSPSASGFTQVGPAAFEVLPNHPGAVPNGAPFVAGTGLTESPGWVVVNNTAVNGEFVRTPSALAVAATSFTLTTGQGVGNPLFPLGLEIVQPGYASPGIGNGPSDYAPYYTFSWNYSMKAGSDAYWVDALGQHPINTVIGMGVFTIDWTSGPGTYGFYVSGDSQALQIQNWQAVPEPSGIAMGLLTLTGIGGIAYRRFRTAKV